MKKCWRLLKQSDTSSPIHSLFQLVPSMPDTDETESGLWASPTSSTGGPEPEGKTGRKLVTQVTMWPTPTASMDGGANNRTNHPNTPAGKKAGRQLQTEVKLWPTQSARDWKSGKSNQHGKNSRPLNEVATLFPTVVAGDSRNARNSTATRYKIPPTGVHAGDTLTDAVVPQGGSLNPDWVEWLQGYPIGWTDLNV